MKECVDYCPVDAISFNEQEKQCKLFMKVNSIGLYDKCFRVD